MLPTRRQTLLGFTALAALSACAAPTTQNPTVGADADMARVLTTLVSMGGKPIETLTAPEARLQPNAAQAAMRVQQQTTGSAAPMPIPRVQAITVQGAAGALPARLYGPAAGEAPVPVILYFQGGGWVIADLDTYDASCRALAAGTGAIVVSVQYRKGPENRFPAAHDDAVAAYRWLLANARSLGGDPSRIALVGESAGGNLAIATAIAARDLGLPRPVHQVLIYPVAGTDLNGPSVTAYRQAKPLNSPMLTWFLQNYTANPADLQDPRLDVAGHANLLNLPSTTMVFAEIDPLRSGGEVLATKLASGGVQVDSRSYSGVTHEFFGMGSVVAKAKQAQDYVSMRLTQAFAAAAAMPASTVLPPVRRRS